MAYKLAGLFDLSWPIFTLPSASPYLQPGHADHMSPLFFCSFVTLGTCTSSFCLLEGHVNAVMGEVCKNLLHMVFLSPHSSPSLYTKTILSLWAIANLVESGEKLMALTTYVFGPLSAGLVENLSAGRPWSSNSRTTRSDPQTASLRLLGE